ncbi:hypothetical protein LJC07_04740 [Christensenellaceae bacterium OttesenSCG-928-L17]|nr:hypothetical protein [Christensenellaceae bacterium OttesenSCG-928-L17]
MSKFFRNKAANVIEEVKNPALIKQYEKHTETYEPCDKSGKKLAAKASKSNDDPKDTDGDKGDDKGDKSGKK